MRRFVETLLREPLVHFALLGGLLCVAYLLVRPVPRERIVVPSDLMVARQADLQRRLGRIPTDSELRAVIAEYVESEVLYREAQRRQLGEGDIIIRRRLTQKMEYLADALLPAHTPTDPELAALLDSHKERYLLPPRVSVRQVFVSVSSHKNDAESVAKTLRDQLKAGADPSRLGDPHPLGGLLPLHSQTELAQLFSASWAAAVFSLSNAEWSAPVRSPFGFHVIQLVARQPGALPSFSLLRERLLLDYAEQHRESRRKQAVAALLARYEVVLQGGK